MHEIESARDGRALVVTGAGAVFSAGMDLNRVTEAPKGASADVEDFWRFLQQGCAKPVVAAGRCCHHGSRGPSSSSWG